MSKSDVKGAIAAVIVVLAGFLYAHKDSAPTDSEQAASRAGYASAASYDSGR